MKKGYVRNETFLGSDLIDSPIPYIRKKIGLSSTTGDYVYIGYKTSVLAFLLENIETVLKFGDGSGVDQSICISVSDVADKASKMYSDAVMGGALGALGGMSTAVGALATAADAISVAHKVDDLLPSRNPSLQLPKKPGRFNRVFDKAWHKRIIVRASCYKGGQPGWLDTELSEITLADLAVVVNAHG